MRNFKTTAPSMKQLNVSSGRCFLLTFLVSASPETPRLASISRRSSPQPLTLPLKILFSESAETTVYRSSTAPSMEVFL